MDSTLLSFENLKAGRLHQQIVGRMLRHWPARNVKKGGQLMGVDFLLIDEKSCLIHGSINVTHLSNYENLLCDGGVYSMSDFEVTRSNSRFKLTDSPFSIRFLGTTVFEKLNESVGIFPKEFFRFRTHDQLLSLANTNTDLPDVMGQVCSSKAYRNGITQTLERMLVVLSLESGEKVRLSAFDDHATSLETFLSDKEAATYILLATNLNPKLFGGELYLNATSGTKFYSEVDLTTTAQFADRLKARKNEDTNFVAPFHGVSKIEHISIDELNQFVSTGNAQEVEFLCTATVTSIQTHRGWSFISCAACGTKMVKKMSSLTCNNYKCGSTTGIGDVKYRVELVVDDGMTTGVFVAFDKDMVKLTNIQAATLCSQMTDGQPNSDSGAPIPKQVSDIVGKQFTFQLKLTNFNFTPHHQSFTVSRIFDKTDMLPGPTFIQTQAEGGKMQALAAKGGTTSTTQQNPASPTSAATIMTPVKTLDSGDFPLESSSGPKSKKQKKHNST